jgi:hypothetical protein
MMGGGRGFRLALAHQRCGRATGHVARQWLGPGNETFQSRRSL